MPVLGICYGMQTMAAQLGGTVEPGRVREFGYAEVRARGHSALLRDIEDRRNAEGHGLLDVWMSHGDKVIDAAAGLHRSSARRARARSRRWPTSRGASTACSSIPRSRTRSRARRSSPVSRTTSAAAATTGTCTTTSARRSRRSARRSASDEVLLGLSGGVDSSVAAALMHRAIGDQLTCVFVDHGLLRRNEAEQVMRHLRDASRRARRSRRRDATNSSRRSPASTIRSASARSSAGCSSTCSSAKRRS